MKILIKSKVAQDNHRNIKQLYAKERPISSSSFRVYLTHQTYKNSFIIVDIYIYITTQNKYRYSIKNNTFLKLKFHYTKYKESSATPVLKGNNE